MQLLKILFLLLFNCFAYSQSDGIKVKYKTVSNYDISKLENDPTIDTYKLDYAKKLKSYNEEMTYTLKASRQESIFETIYQMDIGAEINPIANFERDQKFYINTEEYIEAKNFQGEDLLISEDSYKQNWKIVSGNIEVLGIQCKKASLTYKEADNEMSIIAWFAPNLNYSFGPKGFHGLPGLILKIERNDVLILEATEIKDIKSLFITKPYKGKRITRESFNNRMLAIIEKMKQ